MSNFEDEIIKIFHDGYNKSLNHLIETILDLIQMDIDCYVSMEEVYPNKEEYSFKIEAANSIYKSVRAVEKIVKEINGE